MKIDIQIKNKIARLTKPTVIVCGNSDYVIKFDFDAEWADYQTKTARFSFGAEYADVVFDGDEVSAPVLKNTVAVSVGVYAGDIRTTTAAVIPCLPSVTSSGGIPADPTPDAYAQIMEKLNTLDGVNPATVDKLGVVKIGENLKITKDGVLSVDTADAVEQDNTKPVTSAAVHTEIGNIEVLLAAL